MSEPILVTSGKFSLYQTPKGGMHLSLQVEGETEPRHVEIPAMMVRMMMRKAGNGNGLVPAEIQLPDFSIDSTPEIAGE